MDDSSSGLVWSGKEMHLSFAENKEAILSHPQDGFCKIRHVLSRKGGGIALVPCLMGAMELSVFLGRARSGSLGVGWPSGWLQRDCPPTPTGYSDGSHSTQCVVQDLERET